MFAGKRFHKFMLSAAGLVLLAAVLAAINYAASKSSLRIDCTEQRLNTLSPGTIKVLKGLKAPVTLRFYYSSSVAQTPVALQNYAQRVENLLKECKRAAGSKLTIEKLDPKPDSDAEDSANLNGISGQSLPSGDNVYFGIAASSLDQSYSIPFLSLDRESFLEYDIVSAIARVTREGKPVLGFVSSLPVSGKQAPMVMMGGPRQQEPPWLFYTELKKDYDIRDLGMDFPSVPEDINTLILIHPKLSEGALYAIDQFLMRGGRLAAFLDPACVVDAKLSQSSGNMFAQPQISSTLGKLLDAWGVKFDSESVVADLQLATKLRGAGGSVERDPTWLSITDAQLDQKDPSVAQLQSLLMVVGGSFSGDGAEGLKKTVLVKSTDDSGLVNKFVAQMGADAVLRDFKADKKEKALAIRLEGKFKSAFPDGSPDAAKDAKKAASPKTAAKEGAVILVGDVDMLYDSFTARVQEMFGERFAVPLNDNIALVQNVAGLLSGDDALLGLRSRGVAKRPFEVVDKMQAVAEQRYREQIKSLETELADAQSQLSSLRQQKGDISSQKFIMSPEVKATIEKFKQKEAGTRAQLKALRKSLRSDIDSLEVKIKWLNMALMPALVALLGVAIGLIRKWRAKA